MSRQISTPRTDSIACEWNEIDINDGDAVVPVSFARELERELILMSEREQEQRWLKESAIKRGKELAKELGIHLTPPN